MSLNINLYIIITFDVCIDRTKCRCVHLDVIVVITKVQNQWSPSSPRFRKINLSVIVAADVCDLWLVFFVLWVIVSLMIVLGWLRHLLKK